MHNFYTICLLAGAILACISTGCSKSSSPASQQAAAITGITPNQGPDSTQVIISGTGFGANQADNAVFFNGKQATVLSATTTSITTMVPTLAGTGNVTVTVNGNTLTGGVFTYDTTWRVYLLADNLQIPFYVSLDANDNLYVPTYNNGVINKITQQGTVTAFANAYCWGTAMDAAGDLYVVANRGDSGHIYEYSPAGVPTQIAVDSGTIYSIALDKNGNIYASNNGANTVDKITPQGAVSVVARNLYYCSGIGVASDGTIYVTNYTSPAYNEANGVVTKISPSGTASTVTQLLYDGQNGIAVDTQDNVYVTVFDQVKILGYVDRITPSGTATTLVSANLKFPLGIAVDQDGNLYVVQQVDAPSATVGSVVKMVMH